MNVRILRNCSMHSIHISKQNLFSSVGTSCVLCFPFGQIVFTLKCLGEQMNGNWLKSSTIPITFHFLINHSLNPGPSYRSEHSLKDQNYCTLIVLLKRLLQASTLVNSPAETFLIYNIRISHTLVCFSNVCIRFQTDSILTAHCLTYISPKDAWTV